MARQRDYKAEYAARIARGQRLGLSRSQAAGHPKRNEPRASQIIATIRQSNPQLVARQTHNKNKAKKLAEGYRNGQTITAKVRQDSKTKQAQEVEINLWTGSRPNRMAHVLDYLATQDPQARVRISFIDNDGNAFTIYQHGGRSAESIHAALDLFLAKGGTFTDFWAAEYQNVYGQSSGDLRHQFARWEIAAIPSA